MRMKFKPWARPELEESPIYIDNPQEYKNKWKNAFEKEQDIHIELRMWERIFYFSNF